MLGADVCLAGVVLDREKPEEQKTRGKSNLKENIGKVIDRRKTTPVQ